MSATEKSTMLGNQNSLAMIVVAVVLFAAGFFLGQLWQENKMLKSGGAPTVAQGAAQPDAAANPNGPSKETLALMPEVTNQDHIRGAKNPVVTLVEYADFECPFCNRFHPTIMKVLENYGDKVAVVYRHYPLSFHPLAEPAAEASECVFDQKGNDGFFIFGDYLFDQQQAGVAISDDLIRQAAQEASVNLSSFDSCIASGSMKNKITEQMNGGSTAGVSGTPGTIVVTKDGPQELIPGAFPYESVEQTIQKYL